MLYYSLDLSSNFTNTSLGFEPFGGPIIPLSYNKSTILAALLYPRRYFLWINEALILPLLTVKSTISLYSGSSYSSSDSYPSSYSALLDDWSTVNDSS